MTDQHQHRATPEQIRSRELLHLRRRIEALEATQRAHIEAGARCAVEQMHSKPGWWQPLKVETTYGSDAPMRQDKTVEANDLFGGAIALELERKLDRLIEQDRSNAQQLTLVERVAKRLARFAREGLPGDDAMPIASAVLCDVAEWLRAGAVSNWGLAAADLLDNEALHNDN